MKNENKSACPNCSELWNRIDRLEQEKAKLQKNYIIGIVCTTIMATLAAVNLFVTLIK
jgi:uncharacterized protein (UPF0335 family)